VQSIGSDARWSATTLARRYDIRPCSDQIVVRRAAVESLAAAGGAELQAILKDCAADTSSRVRVAAVRALGNTNNRDLVPFFKAIFPKDTSYVVQGVILAAIGKCGGPADVSFLKKASVLKSPRNILKGNADAAIKKIEETAKKK